MMRYFIPGLLGFCLLVVSCAKEQQSKIPYVSFYKEIYPNTLDYIPVGGYIYVENAGYRGLVIYHPTSGTENDFVVYERCCPYDPENPYARVKVNSNQFTLTDTCCKSTYTIIDGAPTGSGPSRFSLVQYHYTYDGDKLIVYN